MAEEPLIRTDEEEGEVAGSRGGSTVAASLLLFFLAGYELFVLGHRDYEAEHPVGE